MEGIGISIIITAYNRKEFLLDAINSVLKQTVDKSSYEIIVISNFDVDVSQFDPEYEIRTVFMDGTIGEFLFRGINMAKYNIIAFLDDDDTFEIEKLSRLIEIFSSNQGLCYYHNSMRYVNSNRQKIDYVRLVEKRSRTINGQFITFNSRNNLNKIKAALENRGDFNLSSIAISKDFYQKYLHLLRQIKSNQDGFFFWTGIISMGQLVIDNVELTNYRVHEMNVSGQLSFYSKAQEVQKEIYTFDLILSFLEESNIPFKNYKVINNWILLFKYEYELMSAIFSNSRRGRIMILIKRLFSINLKYSNTLKYRILLISFLAIINSDYARMFYLKVGIGNQRT